MKICKSCNQEKSLDSFGKKSVNKDGLNIYCKKCANESAKLYEVRNKEMILKRKREYYENNKDIINKKRKTKEYRDKRNEKRRNITDKLYRVKNSIRVSIGRSIKNRGFLKNKNTENILGISYTDFYKYLESKFEPWMTWENYGKYNGEFNYGWDIDHIIPLISSTSIEEVIALNHYTNLQPLCSKINRDIKKDNYITSNRIIS